jgi:hypothetical protein
MNSTNIILGPKTRLARALIKQLGSTEETLLISRNESDSAWLLKQYPGLRSIDPAKQPFIIQPTNTIRVFCCAMGPIHVQQAITGNYANSIRSDLKILEKTLNGCCSIPCHLVFVSSILALAMREKCIQYSVSKNMAQSSASTLIRNRPNTLFSTVYPGRLFERTLSKGFLWNHLHTSFTTLAQAMIVIAMSQHQKSRIIGIDAHLLLMAQGMKLWLMALGLPLRQSKTGAIPL